MKNRLLPIFFILFIFCCNLAFGVETIWTAAADGNLALVQKFIEKLDLSPNITNAFGFTPSYYAAVNGNMDVLQYLKSKKADFNHMNVSYYDEHHDLLKLNANLLYFTIISNTNNRYQICDYLLANGCHINDTFHIFYNSYSYSYSYSYTPLFMAISDADYDLVKYLISKGASLDSKWELYDLTGKKISNRYDNAITAAFDWQNINMNEMLPHIDDHRELQIAKSYYEQRIKNSSMIVRYLIVESLKYKKSIKYNISNLEMAVLTGNLNNVKEYLKKGSVPEISKLIWNDDPRYYDYAPKSIDLCLMLDDAKILDFFYDMELMKEYDNSIVLSEAGKYQASNCVNMIITNRIGSDISNISIGYIIKQNQIDLAKILISKGVNLNADFFDEDADMNYSPLYYFLQNEQYDMAKLLIDSGADISALTNKQYNLDNIVDECLRNKKNELAKILIKNGFSISPWINETKTDTTMDVSEYCKKYFPDDLELLDLVEKNEK